MDGDDRRPLIAAGTSLGVGLGGFVDGILFHQILQTHNMLSAKYPTVGVDLETFKRNVEVNMFWDGLFHAGTWAVTALGVALLWRALGRPGVPRCARTFVGSLALGWGLFNLVEGLINHHLLHTHHLTQTADHLAYDVAFLASGAALIAAGSLLIGTARKSRRGTGDSSPAAP